MDNNDNENTQELSSTICGSDFTFIITRNAYNKYIDAMNPNAKKGVISHNFLMQTVVEEGKKALLHILDNKPGADVQLAGALLEEYMPDLGIQVKKPSSTLTR